MLLATQADVEKRLSRSLTEEEAQFLDGPLEEASALVEAWCGRKFTEPVPDAVRIVVSRMVARTVEAPEVLPGLESEQVSAGSFQQTSRFGSDSMSGGPWLTRKDKTMLKAFGPRVVSVALW